jgi:hypothetical protein
MKIIDLLNKIAEGEKIRFKDKYRNYDECDISTFLENYITANWDWVEDDTDWLNEEVEVEDKEYEDIEEIDLGERCLEYQTEVDELKVIINVLIRNQKKILERLDK